MFSLAVGFTAAPLPPLSFGFVRWSTLKAFPGLWIGVVLLRRPGVTTR